MNESVIVVGAGIAGLYAAVMLKEEGYKVTLLEASERIGGRISSNTSFAKTPIELGAEYIHGKRSLLYEYMAHINQPVYKFQEKLRYYTEGQIISRKKAKEIPALREAIDFFYYQWHYEGEEMTVQEYLHQHPNLRNYKAIIEGFAAEYGTTTNRLGMRSLAMEERKWDSGSKNYRVAGTLEHCLQPMVDELENELKLSHAVDYIAYGSKEVVVTTTQGKKFKADCLILTVPLSILKENTILFDPPLPADKLAAIHQLGIDDGMKIFLRFKKIFWQKKMTDLYGASRVPVYLSGGENEAVAGPVLTAYVMGEKATHLKAQKTPIRDLILEELDEIYEGKASKHFEDILIADWGEMPYIRGCYSFATPNSIGKRAALAKPVHDKLFFAGEATNTWGHASTMHGAMETAYRAVEDLIYLHTKTV